MASGAFSSVNRRRVKRDKEMEKGGKKGEEKLSQHQSIRYAFGKRPNVEWDYESFSVIVAKADERAIGAGLEKMISERRLMASYNWDVDSWIPTIVVPGAPKVFRPWLGGLLETRNQVMTIDEESFRIPNAPMEPLFTAVRLCHPDFKLRDVDLVADLNCLKKLLRFVLRAAFSTPNIEESNDDQGANTLDVIRNIFAGANNDCDFRIDAQVIGRTVVLMRREAEHRGRAMGYGVGYLEACTQPYDDPRAAGPHKRITYVKFGGLRLLLRHKVLAAIYPDTMENEAQNRPIGSHGDGTSDNRSSSSSSVGVSSVRHVRGGYLGDHNKLTQVEFASVSKERKSPLVIDKWLDMLFIGSDNIYLGEHIRGRFQEPTMRHRTEALELSGMKPSDGRRILVILEMLLEKIVQYGRRSSAGRRGGKGAVDGGGDGNERRQASVEDDPVSFSLVSRDECRKLVVFKNGPSKGRNAARDDAGKRSDTSPPCVSEAMMASLLADD